MAAGALAFQRNGREELLSAHKTKFQKEHGRHIPWPLRWLTLRCHTSFWPERGENPFGLDLLCFFLGSSQERRGILKLAVTLNFTQLPQFRDIEKKTIHGYAVYLKLAGQAKKEEEKLKLAVALNFTQSFRLSKKKNPHSSYA
jgi:hypothetical protein